MWQRDWHIIIELGPNSFRRQDYENNNLPSAIYNIIMEVPLKINKFYINGNYFLIILKAPAL